MATYADTTGVGTLRTLYKAYADTLAHTDATTQAALRAEANRALNLWADAHLGINAVNASAAENYANGVGMSVTKKKLDDLQAAADGHWAKFVQVCGLGGQTIPTVAEDAASYWDLSGMNDAN